MVGVVVVRGAVLGAGARIGRCCPLCSGREKERRETTVVVVVVVVRGVVVGANNTGSGRTCPLSSEREKERRGIVEVVVWRRRPVD